MESVLDQELIENIDELASSIKGVKNDYVPTPVDRPEPIENSKGTFYPRDRLISLNALMRANYRCEIEENHPSFLRKSTGKNYTEPHHLIPMAFQKQFEKSLDVEANIYCLPVQQLP